MSESDSENCQLHYRDAAKSDLPFGPNCHPHLNSLPESLDFTEPCPWMDNQFRLNPLANSPEFAADCYQFEPFVKQSYFTVLSPEEPPDSDSDFSDQTSQQADGPSNRQKKISKPKTQIPATPLEQIRIRIRGCGCQTSNCLRRYCKCFSSKGYCGDGCGCTDCFNTSEFEDQRKAVIEKTQEINHTSFEPKIASTKAGIKINVEGCRCKSGCRSKLCQCSKNGVGCSPICKCSGCVNEKVDLEPEEVRLLFRNPIRTKERILIASAPLGKSLHQMPPSEVTTNGLKMTVVVFNRVEAETSYSRQGREFLPT